MPYKQWINFSLIKGSIENYDICKKACKNIDYVLHQAAIGSVPRSIKDPVYTNTSNVSGFLNMITAAKNAKVKKFVYASSSSVYGNNLKLPKIEKNHQVIIISYTFLHPKDLKNLKPSIIFPEEKTNKIKC